MGSGKCGTHFDLPLLAFTYGTHAYTHIHVQTYSVAGQELLDAGLSSSSEKEVPIEMEVK